MTLERWIALLFLAGSAAYAYAAFTYPLLPFERNMSFLPNTWPKVLSVVMILLSAAILLQPRAKKEGEEDVLGSLDLERFKDYEVGQALMLIGAMILYALALRPVGFIASTVIFLVAAGWILGERKPQIMVPVALIASGIIWYLVQETLGIYLRPLPAFLD